eukprot:792590-Prorocentrum_minimum.AAC.1
MFKKVDNSLGMKATAQRSRCAQLLGLDVDEEAVLNVESLLECSAHLLGLDVDEEAVLNVEVLHRHAGAHAVGHLARPHVRRQHHGLRAHVRPAHLLVKPIRNPQRQRWVRHSGAPLGRDGQVSRPREYNSFGRWVVGHRWEK